MMERLEAFSDYDVRDAPISTAVIKIVMKEAASRG
jgi:hypothetical protein